MENTYKKLFRTCVFGGYRKKDVRAYVGKLEAAIEEMEKQMANGAGSLGEAPGKRHWVEYKAEPDGEERKEEFGNVIVFDDEP